MEADYSHFLGKVNYMWVFNIQENDHYTEALLAWVLSYNPFILVDA